MRSGSRSLVREQMEVSELRRVRLVTKASHRMQGTEPRTNMVPHCLFVVVACSTRADGDAKVLVEVGGGDGRLVEHNGVRVSLWDAHHHQPPTTNHRPPPRHSKHMLVAQPPLSAHDQAAPCGFGRKLECIVA